jgi:Holliday junction DNA helicase RuvA
MYEYIQGKITELTPASVVIDNQGIGYFINI